MADINQQTEELARKFEQLTQAIGQYDQLTKSSADQKRDAEVQAATGIKNFTKGAAAGANAVGELAGAAMSAGKAMLEGKKGATAFNESLDGLSKAATAAGVALTLLVPGGAIIKGVVAGFTAVTSATIGMVKASNEMADKLYKGYSGLANSGAAASDGMTGVFNDAKKLGLSMNQLDSFVGLVNENAGDLSLFAGSVFEGRKRFAEIGKAMEPFRTQLIAAGFNQEQINEGTLGYIRLQSRLGRSQTMTTTQLADGARKYLVEMDALSKMTGQTRKEMESSMEAARSEQRFRAKLEEVRLTKGEAAAKRLELANVVLSARSKDLGQAFRDGASGMYTSEAAQKGLRTTMGELGRSTQQLIDGQIDEYQLVTNVGGALRQFTTDLNVSGQLGTFNESFLDFAQSVEFANFAELDRAEQAKIIAKMQADQGLKGAKNADTITQKYAETEKKLQELNEKFETTVFKGIDNALEVNVRLANATDVLATGFEKLGTAVNRLLNIVGLGVKEPAAAPVPKTAREAEAVAAVSKERSLAEPLEQLATTKRKQLEADEKALMDAKRSGKFGDDLKPLEEKIIKSKEDYATASKDLAEQQKKVVDATREERKVKMQQKQDQNRLMLLEGINIRETEGIARLNVEKADLAAKGVDTAKKDQKIAEFKANIEERNKQIATIKQRLAPVAPKLQTDASGRATATSDSRSAVAGTTPAAPATQTPLGGAAPVSPAASKMPTAGSSGVNEAEQQMKAQNLFNFLGGISGRESNYNRLDSQFRERLTAMASEYQGLTNKKLDFGSGARSEEENKQVGGVGTSNHLKGKAVDLSSRSVNELISLGLLSKHGFTQNPKSDWHISDNGYRDGGIASGPETGYNALLHGTEAIIPLKNGAVPVEISSDFIDSAFDRDMRREVVEPSVAASETASAIPTAPVVKESSAMMELLKEAREQNFSLLAMISELVREQRNANDISTRILQVSSN
jgi:hypothetical protein